MNMNNEIISFEVMTCILYNFEDFFHIHVCLLFMKYSVCVRIYCWKDSIKSAVS